MSDVRVKYLLVKKVSRQSILRERITEPKRIDFRGLVEDILGKLGLNMKIVKHHVRITKDKIILEGRLRVKTNNDTKIYNTYLYIEQELSGAINGNIAITWIKHTKLCGVKKAFITGKTHYLLFMCGDYVCLGSINITTNIVTEEHPLYAPLHMEIFGTHPLYSINKPHIPLRTPTIKELLNLLHHWK